MVDHPTPIADGIEAARNPLVRLSIGTAHPAGQPDRRYQRPTPRSCAQTIAALRRLTPIFA